MTTLLKSHGYIVYVFNAK